MLSPNPLSLLCALLLCFPLAILFTVTTTPDPTTISSAAIVNDDPVTGSASTSINDRVHITQIERRSSRFVPVLQSPPAPKINTTTSSADDGPAVSSAAATVRDHQKGIRGIEPLSPPANKTQPLAAATPPPPKIKHATTVPAAPPPQPASYDDPEDDALFRVAGRAAAKAKNPKKVAFMFLTTGPLPLAELWEMYFNGTPRNLYNIYVHADPGGHYHSPFRGVFFNRVIPSSRQALRATPTLISAARRLLAHALLDDPGNYMFALLSPSCIPLRSFNFTRVVLTRSRKSFVEILDGEPWAFDRWAARGEDAMLPEVRFEDFRIGSQFWALKRSHARLVVRDVTLWSKFKLPCLRWDTCYPEENYFPTLLSMQDPRGCVPATLTHVDWRGHHDGHPRTYRADEVGPDLIQRLRSDRPRYGDNRTDGSHPFLFARKFEPKALKALMAIAKDIIFKD